MKKINLPLIVLLGLASVIGIFYGGIKYSENKQNKLNKNLSVTTIPTPTSIPINIVDHPVDKPLIITQIPKKTQTQIQKATVLPTKTIISTDNWKTYKNGNLGFQLKYPETWAINDKGQNNVLFSDPENGMWLLNITVEVINKSFNDNVQLRINELKEIIDNPQIKISNMVLSGIMGKKLAISAEGGASIEYLFQSGDRFYLLAIRSESESEEDKNILKSFQLIPISDFGLINGNYKIIKNTSTQLSIQGPGYSGNVKDLVLNFYKFKKPAGQRLEDWIEQNKNNFPSAISFEGTCQNFGSSETVELYNCGRWSEEDYLVNKTGDSILFIGQGQDPPLTSSELLNLISFR